MDRDRDLTRDRELARDPGAPLDATHDELHATGTPHDHDDPMSSVERTSLGSDTYASSDPSATRGGYGRSTGYEDGSALGVDSTVATGYPDARSSSGRVSETYERDADLARADDLDADRHDEGGTEALGAGGGALGGAAIGGAIGGPPGAVIGGVAGAAGGAMAGEAAEGDEVAGSGGGATAGTLGGAALGGAFGGPPGAVIGGAVGAGAGAGIGDQGEEELEEGDRADDDVLRHGDRMP